MKQAVGIPGFLAGRERLRVTGNVKIQEGSTKLSWMAVQQKGDHTVIILSSLFALMMRQLTHK